MAEGLVRRFGLRVKHFKPRERELVYVAERLGLLPGRCWFNYLLPAPERPRRPFESLEEYLLWRFLRSKEIDAVCETEEAIYIIEFKDRARPSGIGQLLTYRDLYVENERPSKPVKLRYIVGEGDPQVEEVARRLGIEVFVLGIPAYKRRYFRPEEFGLG